MADQRIAAAFIEVAAKGLQKVQSDLNQIKSKLNETAGAGKTLDDATKKSGESAKTAESAFAKLGGTINGIGAVAAKSFFGLTAAIGAAVKTASPKGFDDLQLALFKVSLQMGRIFLPILIQVTEWINKLADWLKSLTDEQREQILHWVKIALVVAGGIFAFSKLFGLLTTGISVVKGFASVLTLLGSATPIGWIIGLVGVLGTLFSMLSGEGGGFSGIFASIGPALQNLVATFQRVFAKISEFVGKALEVLAPVFDTLAGIVAKVFEALVPVVESLLAALMPVIGIIANFVQVLLQSLMPVFESLGSVVVTLIGALAPVFESLVTLVGQVIEALTPIIPPIMEVVTAIIDALKPAFELLISVVQAVVAVVGPVFQLLMAAIRPVINVLSAVLKPVIEFLGTVIQRVGNVIIDVLNGIIAAINSVLEYVPGTDYVGGRRDFQLQRLGERNTETPNRDRPEGQNNPPPGRQRPPANPNDFRGEARQPAAQFVGIAEAWKKLQTAQGEDLAARQQRELLEQTRGVRRGIDRVADNTEPGNDWQGAGGDF